MGEYMGHKSGSEDYDYFKQQEMGGNSYDNNTPGNEKEAYQQQQQPQPVAMGSSDNAQNNPDPITIT